MKRLNPDDIVFYESTHRYFYEGRELTSVTHALESVGISDFSKVHWETLERAQMIGDFVHEIARLHALNKLEQSSIHPDLMGFYFSIKLFFKERVKRVIKVESKVGNLGFGFAGRMDILYLSKQNRLCLDDYTTGTVNHLAKRLQTAAYQYAAAINYKIKSSERASVLLDQQGYYERTIYKNRSDFDHFIACLTVANLKQSHGKK